MHTGDGNRYHVGMDFSVVVPAEPAAGWFPDLPNGSAVRLTAAGAADLGFAVFTDAAGRVCVQDGARWFRLVA